MLLGTLFLILGDLVAPNGFHNLLFWILDAFWARFWEAFGGPGGVWEVIWELFGALGRSLAVIFGFCVENRETVKSVVLLKQKPMF